MLVAFPTTFPPEALDALFDAWKGDVHDANYLAQCAWNAVGFFAGKTIPAPMIGVRPEMHALAPLEADKVEAAFAEAKSAMRGKSEGMHAISIPESVMAIIRQVAVAILMQLTKP